MMVFSCAFILIIIGCFGRSFLSYLWLFLQSVAEYLRVALIFVWRGAPRENSNR